MEYHRQRVWEEWGPQSARVRIHLPGPPQGDPELARIKAGWPEDAPEGWEALARMELAMRQPGSVPHPQQLAEDALMGDPQAGADLARREEQAVRPQLCACGEAVLPGEQLCRDCLATREAALSHPYTHRAEEIQARRSTATLADIEGEPEAEWLPRPDTKEGPGLRTEAARRI